MFTKLRSLFIGSVALASSCADPNSASSVDATDTQASPLTAAANLGALPMALDTAGLPTLLTASSDAPAIQGASASAIAQAHVARLAPSWGVRADALPTLEVLGEVKLRGMTVVRMRQLINGIPVDRNSGGELHIAVKQDGSLVAASGRLFAKTMAHQAPKFVDNDAGAVARAMSSLYKTPISASALSTPSSFAAHADTGVGGGARMLAGQAGNINISRSRAQQVWYAAPGAKSLTAAWLVEAFSSAGGTDGDATRMLISADGQELDRASLKADFKFKYRVFGETTGEFHPFDGPIVDSTPHPTGVPSTLPFPSTPYPAYVTPNLVEVDGTNHPGDDAPADPWLGAPGDEEPTFTETKGNNVDAYADFNDPDGLTFGDFRATVTAPGVFDRTYDLQKPASDSQGQRMAGVTSLFYIVNWMHDFWYDGGFTEAAGNAQQTNYGRGGISRDVLLIEAQDASGRNNANMSTPSDGFSPTMQVYVWDNKDNVRELKLGARTPQTNTASFAPGTFNVTAPTIIANDGVATATDACTALPDSTGKIILVDRGACSFKTKALNVQNSHALGMILANNAATATPPGLGDDPTITTPITIAVLSVTQAEGVALKTAIGAGSPDSTLHREAGPDLDGSLDASVIAHEFGHYVHHRLSVCNTRLCGAMSEGWADFSALLTVTRAGDNLDGAFPMGIFSTRSFLNDPSYFGIRRAPYSVTPSINGWTYKNMANGEAIPTTFPTSGASPTNNAEVHNGGEVWASMLWEGYVALQKAKAADETFDDVRLKMRQYAVAGLLIAPPNGTPTQIRDAILTAVHAASPADHDVLAAAFAKRGFGSCAVSPGAASTDFVGIVDSLEVKARVTSGAANVLRLNSCDADNVLDGGERAQITVTVTNPGPLPATNVTATLRTALAGVHIKQPTFTIGTLAAYSKVNAVFQFDLDESFTAPTASDLAVKVESTGACGPATTAVDIRLNTDDQVSAATTDTFDAGITAWTASHDDGLSGDDELWTHERKSALDGFFVGQDFDGPSDASLTTPELKGTSHVTMKFDHQFIFEFAGTVAAPTQLFDGGVIEYTIDGGKHWKDISDLADPGYTGALEPSADNPLAERPAYAAVNPAFPDPDTVTLDFGNKLDGKDFQIRFRVGSDLNTGAPGWAIDNVAFTGIDGKPFPALVADAGKCETDTGGDDGGCSATGRGLGAANAGAGLFVLAVLLRRRRRAA